MSCMLPLTGGTRTSSYLNFATCDFSPCSRAHPPAREQPTVESGAPEDDEQAGRSASHARQASAKMSVSRSEGGCSPEENGGDEEEDDDNEPRQRNGKRRMSYLVDDLADIAAHLPSASCQAAHSSSRRSGVFGGEARSGGAVDDGSEGLPQHGIDGEGDSDIKDPESEPRGKMQKGGGGGVESDGGVGGGAREWDGDGVGEAQGVTREVDDDTDETSDERY